MNEMNRPGKSNTGRSAVRLQDIADHCGLALSTVSLALRGDRRVIPSTVEIVRKAAQEMGYDPYRNSSARRLASTKSSQPMLNRIVGFFFSRVMDYGMTNYFFRVMQGVLHGASESKFEILTSAWSPADVDPPVIEVSQPYRGGEVDGVVALEQAFFLERFLSLLRGEPNFSARPVVGLVDHCDGTSGVYPDHVRSGYLVASHLFDLGHRRIVDYRRPRTIDEMTYGGQRYKGYQLACAERGFDLEDVLTSVNWGIADLTRTNDIVDCLANGATAIITAGDYDAVVLHRELAARGISIPEDASLISFDDTDPIHGRDGENILTTVRLPLGEIGYEGTRLAIRLILGEEKKDRDIILPVELMARKSTAPPRKRP